MDKGQLADQALVAMGAKEDPATRFRRKARERKQRQRERDKRFGMKTFPLPLAAVQQNDLRRAATAAGHQDQAEYIISLINRDLSQLGLKRCTPDDLKGDV